MVDEGEVYTKVSSANSHDDPHVFHISFENLRIVKGG